jgi:hypothetical protein
MKKITIYLCLMLFFRIAAYSQTNSRLNPLPVDLNNTPQQYKKPLTPTNNTDTVAKWILSHQEVLENSMKLSGYYITQICNMRLNFVNMRIQDFMEHWGYLQQQELTKFNMQAPRPYISNVYISRFSTSLNPNKVTIKYFIKPLSENEMYVTSCEFSGYTQYIIDIFINYWPTTLNFEDCKKGEVVYNYFLQDRAGLYIDPSKATARIKINLNNKLSH